MTITRNYTVWCQLCGHWDEQQDARKPVCVKRWKKFGWKLTKRHGWLCPRCVKEQEGKHEDRGA